MFLFPFNKLKADCEKRQTASQRIVIIETVLESNFPLGVFIFNAVFNILLGIGSIVLQIISIQSQSPLYYVYAGIWVGAILILAELISFVLLWRRSYPIFMNITIIHFVSGTIAQALAFMYSQVLMNPGTYGTNGIWITALLFVIGNLPILSIVVLDLTFRYRVFLECK